MTKEEDGIFCWTVNLLLVMAIMCARIISIYRIYQSPKMAKEGRGKLTI